MITQGHHHTLLGEDGGHGGDRWAEAGRRVPVDLCPQRVEVWTGDRLGAGSWDSSLEHSNLNKGLREQQNKKKL